MRPLPFSTLMTHTSTTLREQVIQAAQHRGGLKMLPCLAVDPLWFAAIQADVRLLQAQRPASDVSSKTHPTNWTNPYGQATQHSLLNTSGKTEDMMSDHDGKTEGKVFSAPECAAILRLQMAFAGRAMNFRMNGLMAKSGLSPHEENIIHGEHNEKLRMRFHLPVISNENARMMLDGEQFRFLPGYIYFFNNGCVHSADNSGDAARYHFVWDVFLDDWIAERVCDANSPLTPDEGLRKLSPQEVRSLSVSTPWHIEEYINYKGQMVKVPENWAAPVNS